MEIKIGSEVQTIVAMNHLHSVDENGRKRYKPRSIQVKKGSIGFILQGCSKEKNFQVEFKDKLLVLHKDCIKLVEDN